MISKRRLVTKTVISFLILFILFISPNIFLSLKYGLVQFDSYDAVPEVEYGVVFGAKVYEDGSLSDVVKERVEAGVELYKQGKVQRLFISGTNSSNKEVERMAAYAVTRGVPAEHIVQDHLGIDTHDTCRHFASLSTSRPVLITQSFHLPRALFMCERRSIFGYGLQVDKLGILGSRGTNFIAITQVRVSRFFREAFLNWMFVFGLYDLYSQEAELIERA